MTRRSLLAVMLPAFCASASAGIAPGLSVRGKLIQTEGHAPALLVTGAKNLEVHGDEATLGVLKDKRIAGVDLEAIGHYTNPGLFEVDPIHTKAMFVHQDGKRLLITYWCDVCYIRTYTPGVCWCCQKYTDLDLRETVEP